MTPYMWIASCSFAILWLGYWQRNNRLRHAALMCLGLSIDIALVLILEINRSAIKTALSFELELLKQIHIGFSSIAFIIYFPVLWLGIRLLRNRATQKERELHRRLAITALFARTLGFIFMFSMWGGGKPPLQP